MSACNDIEVIPHCFDPDDTTLSSVSLNKYVKFRDGQKVWYYATAEDPNTAIDPATYLGGGTLSIGECRKEVECRESQEYTYAWDNTGTDYRWVDATYEIEWSDGSTSGFTQTAASNANWSAQLTEMAASAQTDVNGVIRAFFEPRYVDSGSSGVPDNITGNINGPGGAPSGLPGAPSGPIAIQLIEQGMAYRYVNVQVCPGEPVPVAVRLIEVADQGAGIAPPALPFDLTTTSSAILGPKNKFQVCEDCGEESWLIYDIDEPNGLRPATAGEIPNCWEPCGTLIDAPAPPESDCRFEFDVACDNNNQANTANFTNTITRRAKICGGEEIAVDYFQEDPNDPAALIPYTLVGDFVDCSTGEPIELPVNDGVITNCDGTVTPETFDSDVRLVGSKNPIAVYQVAQCSPYVRTEDIKLCEVDARFLLLIDSNGVFARYSFFSETWETVNTLSVSSAGGSADVANFLLYNFVAPDQLTVIDVNTDTQLPNVTLIDGPNINPNVATNPKSFSAAAFRDSDGFLYAQDTGGADAGLYRVNVTTGEVDFVTPISGVSGTGTSIAIDNNTDTLYVNGSSGRVYQVDWVTGVGTLVATAPIAANGSTFDTDGNLYVSSNNDTYVLTAGLDGTDPANWTRIIDDFGAGANSIAYYEVVAPQPSCFFRRYGIAEDGTRTLIGDFNVADDSPRTIVGDVDCCECTCGGGGGGGSSDPDESITPLTLVQGTNSNVPAGLKSVTINSLSGVASIDGAFEIGNGRRVDSISYGTDRGNGVNEILPAFTIAAVSAGATWQWSGLQ